VAHVEVIIDDQDARFDLVHISLSGERSRGWAKAVPILNPHKPADFFRFNTHLSRFLLRRLQLACRKPQINEGLLQGIISVRTGNEFVRVLIDSPFDSTTSSSRLKVLL